MARSKDELHAGKRNHRTRRAFSSNGWAFARGAAANEASGAGADLSPRAVQYAHKAIQAAKSQKRRVQISACAPRLKFGSIHKGKTSSASSEPRLDNA